MNIIWQNEWQEATKLTLDMLVKKSENNCNKVDSAEQNFTNSSKKFAKNFSIFICFWKKTRYTYNWVQTMYLFLQFW